MTSSDIFDVLRTLARSQTRFITVNDLCEALSMHEEDCMQILDEFVQKGLLRATKSSRGEAYFWLTAQLSQE